VLDDPAMLVRAAEHLSASPQVMLEATRSGTSTMSVSARSKTWLMVWCLCTAVAGAGLTAACASSTPVTPTFNPTAVVPTFGSGPVQISFLSATPPPGSTISGCGANPTGCLGRLDMTFLLRSNARGHVGSGAVYLFDASGLAGCLGMNIPATDVAAGSDVVTTVRADIANQFCPLPLVIDRMVFTIYDESLRSEQRFQVRYVLLP
jgi:hypothetical protein